MKVAALDPRGRELVHATATPAPDGTWQVLPDPGTDPRATLVIRLTTDYGMRVPAAAVFPARIPPTE